MRLPFTFSRPVEVRSAPQSVDTATLTTKAIDDWIRRGDLASISEENALSIPAISAAIGLVSSSVASLPFHLFNKSADGSRQRATDKDTLSKLISNQVNSNYLTSSAWLNWCVQRMLLEGRAITFIERNAAGRAMNLWPQKLSDIETKFIKGRLTYTRRSDGAVFEPGEILDFIWKLGAEAHSHRSPLKLAENSIKQWIAVEKYGTALFANGGIPPFAVHLPAPSPEAFSRARLDLQRFIKQTSRDNTQMLALPKDKADITPLPQDPSKQQLLETRKHLVIEFARSFANIHPAMIQDHSSSTFSNTEQADINFAKHVITPITSLIEAECNVKLFSDRNKNSFVEFNLDGLMRGDLASRYEAYAKAVQNGFMSPDEARSKENLPSKGGNADSLFIQGATVPLDSQPNTPVQGDE